MQSSCSCSESVREVDIDARLATCSRGRAFLIDTLPERWQITAADTKRGSRFIFRSHRFPPGTVRSISPNIEPRVSFYGGSLPETALANVVELKCSPTLSSFWSIATDGCLLESLSRNKIRKESKRTSASVAPRVPRIGTCTSLSFVRYSRTIVISIRMTVNIVWDQVSRRDGV